MTLGRWHNIREKMLSYLTNIMRGNPLHERCITRIGPRPPEARLTRVIELGWPKKLPPHKLANLSGVSGEVEVLGCQC